MMHIFAIAIIAVGLYGVLFKTNIIKKVMGLSVMTNGINLLLIVIGYKPDGIIPIISTDNIDYFLKSAVDPIPQALVLTSIVINVSVSAFALVLCYRIFKKFNTLNIKKISSLRG
jgi:multisubunit Na+/H+ antiporter MnhC subunit